LRFARSGAEGREHWRASRQWHPALVAGEPCVCPLYNGSMRRRFTAMLVGLSLVLCVAVIGVWVRSYWVADRIRWIGGARNVTFWASRGSVRCWGNSLWPEMTPRGLAHSQHIPEMPRAVESVMIRKCLQSAVDGGEVLEYAQWTRFGIRYARFSEKRGVLRIIRVRLWPIAIGFGILPTVYTARDLRSRVVMRRRSKHGLCPTCGYDLRATPERCPECGKVVTPG